VAYIALGSNLGDREGYLARARAAIASLPETRIIAASSIEETAPLGPQDQPAYLNQMVAVETSLTPRALLTELLEIERREGRRRDVRWGPRTLDLDIVRYAHTTVSEPDLQVPHPEIMNRDFWQRELAELAGATS
jgi:2-amino-4-hydroxy-6-hydroxymethyldihydropteridine diphosphokinase